MKYTTCPKCHEENPENAIHCGVCGTRLDSPSLASSEGQKTPDLLLKKILAGLHLGKRSTPHTGGTAHP